MSAEIHRIGPRQICPEDHLRQHLNRHAGWTVKPPREPRDTMPRCIYDELDEESPVTLVISNP